MEVPQAADEQSSTNIPDAEGEPTPDVVTPLVLRVHLALRLWPKR